MKRLIPICVLLFVVAGCGDSEEKPEPKDPPKKILQDSLTGTWFLDCWLDGDTDIFYQSWEEVFRNDSSFEMVTTFYDSNDCTQNAIARVVYSGSYSIKTSFQTELNGNPSNLIDAWEIDFDIENVEVLGNPLIANVGTSIYPPGVLFDIISVASDVKYDGEMEEIDSNRPTELEYTSDRAPSLIDLPLQPAPIYDTPILTANILGDWDDGCFNDSDTDGAEEYNQRSLIRFPTESTIEFESSIWNSTDPSCINTMVASITLSGVFNIIGDPVQTNISNVPASIIQFTLGGAVYSGDQAVADKSMSLANKANDTYYMLIFYDATYDMFFYGGWFDDTIEDLPNDFWWGITKFGRVIEQ